MAARSIASILVLVLLGSSGGQAIIHDAALKNAIDQSVQDAVAKVLAGFGAAANVVEGGFGAAANVVEGGVKLATNHVEGGVNKLQTKTQTVHQAVDALTQPVISTAGAVKGQVVNDFHSMNQYAHQSLNNLGGQYLSSLAGVGSQLGAGYDAISTVLDGYEAKWCLPATFTPSQKKPAKFTGPSLELSFQSGSCSFNETALITESRKELDCLEPSIFYKVNPANFTSRYQSSPIFTSKQCQVNKFFGNEVQQVLWVFDGKSPVDMNAISSKIMAEVKGMMGSLTGGLSHDHVAAQMQQFMGGLAGQIPGGIPSYTGAATGRR